MLSRENLLQATATRIEEPVWALLGQLNRTLGDQAKVTHFDAMSDAAIGTVIHASLQQAALVADIGGRGLEFRQYRAGPANKLSGCVDIDGKSLGYSIELHLGGPRGGTCKGAHQFAPDDPVPLELFAPEEMPDTLLFFVAYFLTASRTRIDRAFLVFADGQGRERVELRQIESVGTHGADEGAEPTQGDVPQPSIRAKTKRNKDEGDARNQDKRGDAAPGS